MSYTEFKKEHDYLVTQTVFTDAKEADTLVERLERLRLEYREHFNQLLRTL